MLCWMVSAQSRRLEVRCGAPKKGPEAKKSYVHLLNSTLTATERTLCCVLENHQTPDGFKARERAPLSARLSASARSILSSTNALFLLVHLRLLFTLLLTLLRTLLFTLLCTRLFTLPGAGGAASLHARRHVHSLY